MYKYTVLCLVTLAVNALATNGSSDIEQKFDYLFNHIEAVKAQSEAKIASLESAFAAREQTLLDEISDLKSRLDSYEGEGRNGDVTKRQVSRTPVAFYAIAPDSISFQNMPVDKNLFYATPFTNIGNAFHNSSGLFIAPVGGVYAIFVTVGGNIGNMNHFYVSVGGVQMANIIMIPNGPGQASQTIVATMKPGDAVAVKAGRPNDGAYGGYYTSIGGFLVYEGVRPPTVGK